VSEKRRSKIVTFLSMTGIKSTNIRENSTIITVFVRRSLYKLLEKENSTSVTFIRPEISVFDAFYDYVHYLLHIHRSTVLKKRNQISSYDFRLSIHLYLLKANFTIYVHKRD